MPDKFLTRSLNCFLSTSQRAYLMTKKILDKAHDSVPYVYQEIERVIRSQLVIPEKGEELLQSPNVGSFSDVIAKNLAKKLPNMSGKQVDKMINEKCSKSFLDMLAIGLTNAEAEKEYTKVSKKKMFKTVMIANRGEIALRVFRACMELGIETAIVYTKQDKDTLAVRFANKKYYIGSKTSDYLNYKKIVKKAKKAGADAIHPGYGFLSENVDFADLCEKKKIKFIGPTSNAIRLMGNKDMAKQTIIKLDIPTIEGTKALKDEKEAIESAGRIGYPVILKAVSGGGGKGMRIVKEAKDIPAGFKSAQSEAEASFGSGAMYMEKYLEEPRHVEFQILIDDYGNAVHLGERECSIQRRHQKLIEESPSPYLDERLRAKIGEAAIKIVKTVKYHGAGTVEFLIDKNKNFYFMEMNTRIQVEHGITEMVTGVDLIKEQIKIAAGAKLAFKQDDIKIDGCAIECRINAESPSEDFCPQAGTIVNYLPPGGPGIRVCSSCYSGHVVSPHFDSLIAKLMCKGTNRQEAIAKMNRALEEFIIEGISTTIPFHKKVLSSKGFMEGDTTTNFIDKYNVVEQLKKEKPKKTGLSKKEKMLIISTAVSKYLEKGPL